MESGIIVRASSEGSDVDLILYGERKGRGWLFSRHLVDSTDVMAEEPVWIEHDRQVVSTWAAALDLLDRDGFNHLFPVTVHPEFRSKVLKAVLSRNRREGNDWGVTRWHEVCGLLRLDDLMIEMNFQEIQISKLGIFQGKLFAATPSCSKPTEVDKTDWVLALFNKAVSEATLGGKKPVLAVPSSVWPLSLFDLHEHAKPSGLEVIELMDEWHGPHDYGCTPPVESMRQIIDHLKRGVDVIVLSHTMKVSPFVAAVLYVVSAAHTDDPVKLWFEIAEEVGVGLTQFQRGYLCGLLGATAPEWGLRRMTSAN